MEKAQRGPWFFENVDTKIIQIDYNKKSLIFSHSKEEIKTEVFAFGSGTKKKLLKAMKKDKLTFEIRELPSGQQGRANEKFWFFIVDPNQEPQELLEETSNTKDLQQTNISTEEIKLEEQPKNGDTVKSTEPHLSRFDQILKPEWQNKAERVMGKKNLKTPLSKIFTQFSCRS